MSKARNRQAEFRAFEESAPQELDPDSDFDVPSEDSGAEEESEQDEIVGREHYAEVNESRMRKPKEVKLGARYQGARVARAAAFSESDDEAFLDEEAEDGSDSEDGAELDESASSQEDGSMIEDDTDGTDGTDGIDGTDMSEDDLPLDAPMVDKSKVRKVLAADTSAITTSILAATKSDAEKGRAVKRQRTTYDSFLNVRIKMQKALVATNSMVAIESPVVGEDLDQAVEQAETAAFNLWSKLNEYRHEMSKAQSGASPMTADTTASSQALIDTQRESDGALKAHRNAVLQKWSLKSQGVAAATQKSRLNTERPATIVDVLDEHLNNTDRLLMRARTPRSAAPVQVAQKIHQDERIYDDVDFYGLLLKELLESKSAASASVAANIDIERFANIRRETKTRRNVDTKASKGRKLKYTVHEKLQNFCAPDDRSTWGARQSDELFMSLFGRQLGLREDVSAGEDSDSDIADAGLTLFRGGL